MRYTQDRTKLYNVDCKTNFDCPVSHTQPRRPVASAASHSVTLEQTQYSTYTHAARIRQVFLIFLRLGLTSFGGPVAHLGYFRDEFVARRKWFSDQNYADLVALSQFMPGPSSSQVGLAIGLLRAGPLGALAAWAAFTLPSAIAMVLFAIGLVHFDVAPDSAWLQGFKIAAVAVVAKAVLDMMQSLAPDKERATLAVFAMAIALAVPTALGQVAAILSGLVIGLIALRSARSAADTHSAPVPVNRWAGAAALVLFALLLAGLPYAVTLVPDGDLKLIDSFYRSGALVFGGGHVVLPLLQAEVVPAGLVTADQFLAGYGAAQAVPGPLFTFAAYLGAQIGGWPTALLCLVAIYIPSFLLIFGMLPFWDAFRKLHWAQSAMAGINAAVVGLLLAALYKPVWTSGILSPRDFAIAAAAFLALHIWKIPPWLVVPLCALAAGLLSWVG